jgi:hypothetical protein
MHLQGSDCSTEGEGEGEGEYAVETPGEADNGGAASTGGWRKAGVRPAQDADGIIFEAPTIEACTGGATGDDDADDDADANASDDDAEGDHVWDDGVASRRGTFGVESRPAAPDGTRPPMAMPLVVYGGKVGRCRWPISKPC